MTQYLSASTIYQQSHLTGKQVPGNDNGDDNDGDTVTVSTCTVLQNKQQLQICLYTDLYLHLDVDSLKSSIEWKAVYFFGLFLFLKYIVHTHIHLH